MGYSMTVTVQGAERVSAMFLRMRSRAEHMEPVLNAIVRDFRSAMTRQFDSAGAEFGTPWPALSPRTVEDKRRESRDPRILHRTRRMRKSFTQGTEGYRHVTPTTINIGSRVPYTEFHQHGTSKMPARPLFIATDEVSTRWRRMLQSWLLRGQIVKGI